jgi:hypothetical protein
VNAGGGKMSRTLGTLLIVASLGWIPSARAAGTNVKCAMNEDRVWVYESVVDFNLAAKLKCGEPVQIIGRVKGYVKVQTQSGVEGFVADSAFPKSVLPPEPEEKPTDVQSASVAALAHHTASPSVDSKEPRTVATVAPTAPAKSNGSGSASSISANTAMATTATPNVVASSAPARPQPPTIAPAAPPAPKPQPVVVASAPPTPVPAAPVVAAAAPPAAQPAEVEITLSSAPTPAAATSTPPPAPAPVIAAPAPTPAVTSAQPASAPPSATYVSNAASAPPSDRAPAASTPTIQPVSDTAPRAAVSSANPDEDEDSAVRALENENAGCIHYFSAYGLSPNQYKWLAQNRKKAFPSVCPAPNPSLVDFVMIFTHDVAFYNVTMPTAVHVDSNGFSDWTPMSTVDTALMTQSEANSSHHEYVWVFHTNRGGFDPAKFSPRRKPLFSKGETNMLGSHGGYKTVMDALTYIEENTATAR